jgi:hypothetical protein
MQLKYRLKLNAVENYVVSKHLRFDLSSCEESFGICNYGCYTLIRTLKVNEKDFVE